MSDFLQSPQAWRQFVFELPDYAIVFLDEGGHVVGWNEGARVIKGYTADEVIGRHFSTFYTPEAAALGHPERELAVASSLGRYEEQGWRVRKDNTRFWAHVVIRAIYDEQRALRGFGKVVRDFTEIKQVSEQTANIMKLLERTARSDYLTGLDNRRSFDMGLAKFISASRRHQRPLSLGMIDLDRFKDYNDQFGHQAGDVYLKHAAGLWRQSIRPEDFIARYGGEEFVVVLPDTGIDEAIVCLERLRVATPAPLTCSLGVAEWNGVENSNLLIGRADQALYRAKDGGRNRTESSGERSAQ